MRGIISTEDFDAHNLASKIKNIPKMEGQDLAIKVARRKKWFYQKLIILLVKLQQLILA